MTELLAVLNTIAILLMVVIGVVLAVRGGKSADVAIVERLHSTQNNREVMDRLERAYQTANRMQIDALSQIIGMIAPLTPFKSDDALAGFIDDIKTPGKPPTMEEVADEIYTPSDPPAEDDPLLGKPAVGEIINDNHDLGGDFEARWAVHDGDDERIQTVPEGFDLVQQLDAGAPVISNNVGDTLDVSLAYYKGLVGYSQTVYTYKDQTYFIKIDAGLKFSPNAYEFALVARVARTGYPMVTLTPQALKSGETVWAITAKETGQIDVQWLIKAMHQNTGGHVIIKSMVVEVAENPYEGTAKIV